MSQKHLVVVGAGLIGQQHIVRALANDRVGAVSVVDPLLAQSGDVPVALAGVQLRASLAEALHEADGVIIATPNRTHAELAVACLDARVPVLVEKPLAADEAGALQIIGASDANEVPVLVGHHRRHSGVLQAARRVVDSGELGDLVALSGSALFSKPDDYFEEAPWRRRVGGGPLLINLVHDLDAIRFLAGEIVWLRCTASSAARGFEVEDTAVLTFELASGALGTFLLSDAAASHRSWEQTSGENAAYDRAVDEDCYHLAGRFGSLSIPTLRRSRAVGEPSWWTTSDRDVVTTGTPDPLAAQLDHFLDVIDGTPPLVTARDGLQSLRLVLAAQESAAHDGARVCVQAPPDLLVQSRPTF